MQIPLALLDAAAIEEVPLNLWAEVFACVGWPASLTARRKTFTHSEVLEAFQKDDPSDALLEALEALDTLGTESGREAIFAVMTDRQIPQGTLPGSTGERELALRLYLAQREDSAMEEVFARALAQSQERAEFRRYNEFTGKEARAIPHLKSKSRALRESTLMHCASMDLGDHVQVQSFEDDGTYVFHVVRSDRTKKPLAVVPGHKGRLTIQYRPVHADIIRYESAIGRLRIAARAAAMTDFYRRALGKVLFEDEQFFSGDPAYNLKVLQERGATLLQDHGVTGVGSVRMTECLWERSDQTLLHLRATDCFRSLAELGISLGEGSLLQAKLKLEVFGKSTRPVTVNVRAPSRIEVSNKTHDATVDQFLSQIGIRGAAKLRPSADLWSLFPWRHPIGVWRTAMGSHTDALIERGILTAIKLESIGSSDHPGAGSVLEVQSIGRGEPFGVSRSPEIAPRSLSSTDLDGFQFRPDEFQAFLRSHFAISSDVAAWDGGGVLDLGVIEIDGLRLHLIYALRAPTPDTHVRVQQIAGVNRGILLLPPSRAGLNGLPTSELRFPLPSRRELIRNILRACGLSREVSALHSAPDGVRLVVDRQRGQVWLDNVEIPMGNGTHPFRLTEELASKGPSPVSTAHLTTLLSGARQDGNVAARQAKHEAMKCIRTAVSKAGRSFTEDPFPSAGTGYYRCALQSYVA